MQTSDPDAPTQPEQGNTAAAQTKLRDWLLIVLAALAGYADSVAYITLGRVFVANMTGSTVLLGLNLAQGHTFFALRACIALAGFLAGVTIGSAVVNRRVGGEVWPRSVTMALLVEGGVLLIFSLVYLALGSGQDSGPVYPLICLVACAMGIQSVAVRALGVADITTTYITGTWVGMLAGLTRRVRSEIEARNDHRPPPLASLYAQELDARMLLVYITAAVLGALLVNVGPRVAVIPLTPALAVVVGIAARKFRAPE